MPKTTDEAADMTPTDRYGRLWWKVTAAATGRAGQIVRRLRAKDAEDAIRQFRQLSPSATQVSAVPTTETDAYNHPLGA